MIPHGGYSDPARTIEPYSRPPPAPTDPRQSTAPPTRTLSLVLAPCAAGRAARGVYRVHPRPHLRSRKGDERQARRRAQLDPGEEAVRGLSARRSRAPHRGRAKERAGPRRAQGGEPQSGKPEGGPKGGGGDGGGLRPRVHQPHRRGGKDAREGQPRGDGRQGCQGDGGGRRLPRADRHRRHPAEDAVLQRPGRGGVAGAARADACGPAGRVRRRRDARLPGRVRPAGDPVPLLPRATLPPLLHTPPPAAPAPSCRCLARRA